MPEAASFRKLADDCRQRLGLQDLFFGGAED